MENKKAREHRRQEVCRQFRSSGLTRKAFCEKNSFGLSTLGFWLQKDRTRTRVSNGPRMISVGSIQGSELHRSLRIRINNDIIIELDLPATELELRTVLQSVTEQ